MTIRLLTDWPYKRASNAGYVAIPAGSIVSVFDAATETGMIAAKVAVASAAAVTWTPPSDAPIYTDLLPAEVVATRALVSTPGNQPSATLAATVGTPGQIVRLADGPDAGAILVWAIPLGASAYTWCWWLSPTDAY